MFLSCSRIAHFWSLQQPNVRVQKVHRCHEWNKWHYQGRTDAQCVCKVTAGSTSYFSMYSKLIRTSKQLIWNPFAQVYYIEVFYFFLFASIKPFFCSSSKRSKKYNCDDLECIHNCRKEKCVSPLLQWCTRYIIYSSSKIIFWFMGNWEWLKLFKKTRPDGRPGKAVRRVGVMMTMLMMIQIMSTHTHWCCSTLTSMNNKVF